MTHPKPTADDRARDVLAKAYEAHGMPVTASDIRRGGTAEVSLGRALSAIKSVLDEKDAAEAEVSEWRENLLYLLQGNGPDVVRACEGGGPENLVRSAVSTLCATRNSRNAAKADLKDAKAELSSYRTKAETAEEENAKLSDPVAVHLNMLRGTIAKPSIENIIHIYGEDVLRAALRPDAVLEAENARLRGFMARKRFKILGTGLTFDWELAASHETQAKSNHGGQTIQRLDERGGLCWSELLAVLKNEPYKKCDEGAAMAWCRRREAQYLAALQPKPAEE